MSWQCVRTSDGDNGEYASCPTYIAERMRHTGTTEEVVLPKLAATGLGVGKHLILVYSPERADPGNKRYATQNTNRLVGGVTKECTKEGCEVEHYDSYVRSMEVQPQNQSAQKGKQPIGLDSVSRLSVDKVRSADLVAVLTEHSCVERELVVKGAMALPDTIDVTSSVDRSMGNVRAL